MSNERLNTVLLVIVLLLMAIIVLPGKMTVELTMIDKNDKRVAENSAISGKDVLWFNTYKDIFGFKVYKYGSGIAVVTQAKST